MSDGGPGTWTRPYLRMLWLNGVQISAYAQLGAGLTGLPAILDMLAGNAVVQYIGRGDTAPEASAGLSFNLALPATASEDDHLAFAEAAEAGVVSFFPELWWSDTWVVRVAGQASFSTRRLLPWGEVPGVTHSTHPPSVTLNGIEQVVIASGDPAAGEVFVPDETAGNSQWRAIRTPGLSSGDVLKLTYPPLFQVSLAGTLEYPEHNNLRWGFRLEEQRVARRWD